jgi:hypothetical protein
MATNFPTSIDSFTNPSSGDTLDSPSHAAQHTNINDAMVAVQTRLGTGADPIGTWTAFTPTWTFGGNAITPVVSYGRYTIINDLVIVKAFLQYASAAGSGSLTLVIPSACSIAPPNGFDRNGFGAWYDISVITNRVLNPYHIANSTTQFEFLFDGGTTVSDTYPVTVGPNDEFHVTLIGIKA